MEANGKVLVVDDERAAREGCRRILVAEGYEVGVAENGLEGLEKVRAGGCDLVLVDLKMPGMDGMDLLREIRAFDPEIFSIVITGYATLGTAVEATKLGAYDYISKPFTPDELLPVVDKAMARRRLAVEARRLREEREHNLLAVAEERSRIRTIVDSIADGILVVNRDGLLVLHNLAALRLLPEEDSIGKPIEVCCRYEGLVQLVQDALFALDARYSRVSKEMPLEDRTLMVGAAPVRDAAGESLGAVLTFRDITELKRLDRLKSQFVSLVSHELRSPLAAIESYLEVLLGDILGPLSDKQREVLTRSRDRALAMLQLINDLLDISRIESGRVTRQLEPVCLAEVLREVMELNRGLAEEHAIVFAEDLPDDLPPVEADRGEMDRLFTNLVSNAIKYNREGGRVRIVLRKSGEYLRADVEDTGIGISQENQGRLFEEFFRAKAPGTRHVTGTGLGLSLVKKIVDGYHGRIDVQSEPGEGSTFSVYLPTMASR